MVGLGRGAQLGILVRSAEALERAEKLTLLALDKTGTLTEGRMALVALQPAADIDENELLRLAAALEQGSTHPLASAVLEAAKARGIACAAVEGFENVSGQGISGTVEGRALKLGTAEWLQTDRPTAVTNQATDHASATWSAIARLQKLGIECVMLTGDHPDAAQAIAEEAGIKDWRARIKPQEKAAAVASLKADGRVIGMAGDGVNDAPALASADVSFGMASGSDIALEAADITLMRSDLNSVADAVELSRAVMRKIRQNLFLAFFYNILALPLAAAGLLNPVIAGAAMALSSVSVVSNALLLKRWRPK
jgi:Cu+-exporting ATPase